MGRRGSLELRVLGPGSIFKRVTKCRTNFKRKEQKKRLLEGEIYIERDRNRQRERMRERTRKSKE